jgi:hypothetical protein
MKTKSKIGSYLFQPFRYIAGGKSLLLGLFVLLALTVLSYLSNVYFNGIVSIHLGGWRQGPFHVYLYCVFIPWFLFTIVSYLTALILSGKSVRLVDMAGTLALAKAPLILVTLISFIPVFHIMDNMNLSDMQAMISFMMENIVWIFLSGLIIIPFYIWYIVLMYNAYSVSGNLKGTRGVVSFIIALFITSIISQIVLMLLSDSFTPFKMLKP